MLPEYKRSISAMEKVDPVYLNLFEIEFDKEKIVSALNDSYEYIEDSISSVSFATHPDFGKCVEIVIEENLEHTYSFELFEKLQDGPIFIGDILIHRHDKIGNRFNKIALQHCHIIYVELPKMDYSSGTYIGRLQMLCKYDTMVVDSLMYKKPAVKIGDVVEINDIPMVVGNVVGNRISTFWYTFGTGHHNTYSMRQVTRINANPVIRKL